MNLLIRFAAVLCVSAVSCARADLTILQEISGPDVSKPALVTTTKWSGESLRMDAGPSVSILLDSKNGGMVTLMREQKIAVPISQAVQKMAGQIAGKNAAPSAESINLQPTGRKEVLAGFSCEEYAGTISGQNAVIWITKEIPEYKALSERLLELAPQFKQMQGLVGRTAGLEGMPLLTEIMGPDGKKTTIRVQAISREAIAKSDFQIPEGYRKVEMPRMPGVPAGQ